MINNESRCKAILAIHMVMDSIDDGYHNKEIFELVKVSNEIFYEFPERLQEQIKHYFDEKMEERAAN